MSRPGFSFILCLTIALLPSCWTPAGWADWRRERPGAFQVGPGQFTWLGFPVYDAHLWSRAAPVDWGRPFALELVYRRDLSRDTLVRASVDEMQRLGSDKDKRRLAGWTAEMRKAFVDVRAGQRITGLYLPGHGCRFYIDGEFRHAVADAEFARAFFSIWLAPRTRNPQLRRNLLGLNGVDER